MTSDKHSQYMFGIMDPSLIRGIGWVSDVLAFFDALELTVDEPAHQYPVLWTLYRRPVFGEDMLSLFEESEKIKLLMEDISVTDDMVSKLGLDVGRTKLNVDADNMAGIFEGMFKTLTENAPGIVHLRMAKPDDPILETGSVRLGPVEPLIQSRFFKKLPASAFDDADPPLWLRDEIFDEAFYQGKI